MKAEETAQRYANLHSGYRLVSYREVALPLFRVEVDLLVLEAKPIPPIQEFVLRAVDMGLTEIGDVAGFLGIDRQIALSSAVELMRQESLATVGAAEGARASQLQVTERGKEVLVEAAQVQARETSVMVFIDGLTREVLSVTGKGRQWFQASHARGRGLVEIASSPRRRPQLEEIPLDALRDAIRRESAGPLRGEVIGITGLGKAYRYAREGLALAFHTPGEELLVSLVVDGGTSEAHDAAFSKSIRRSARNLAPQDWRDAAEAASGTIPDDLLAEAAAGDSERLLAEEEEVRREDERLRSATKEANEAELSALREQLRENAALQSDLERRLENISVRQVEVYEHRGYLDRALSEAQKRVLIVSPWIRRTVVDDELIGRFRALLDRGVELWIAYGINPDGGHRKAKKGEPDREAEKKLRRLGEDYPALFQMTRLGDTHAKVLVCDSRFSIVTSFNWLSFRGDDRLDFRDERGYYVGLEKQVDEVFESYRARFEP